MVESYRAFKIHEKTEVNNKTHQLLHMISGIFLTSLRKHVLCAGDIGGDDMGRCDFISCHGSSHGPA